jgi:hypothetical protein
VLSPEAWPTWYAYMVRNTQGLIRGWDSDPGDQGYWIVEVIQTIDANTDVVTLKPRKWPQYYMYLTYGNVV